MPAPSATPSGAGNPLDAVQQLQRVVATLAPALRPQVLPKGAAYGLDLLLQQCATDAQRAALRALVHQNKPVAAGKEEQEELMPFVVGAFDVEKKAFSIDKIDWLGQQDALVHQFPRFIELQLESPDEASEVVERFLEANGHDKSDVLAAQQCFNAAFSLQTILRAFPRLPIAIQGKIVQVASDASVEDAFGALFSSVKKTKKAAGGSGKASKSKKRKNKQ